VDTMGQNALLKYITDQNAVDANPSTSEQVFYALKKSMGGGAARVHADMMVEKGDHSPTKLWQTINTLHKDTPAMGAMLIRELHKLVDLTLKPGTVATHFCADYQTSLMRMATFGTEMPPLIVRGLLARAIQDNEFKTSEEFIYSNPKAGAQEILDHPTCSMRSMCALLS